MAPKGIEGRRKDVSDAATKQESKDLHDLDTRAPSKEEEAKLKKELSDAETRKQKEEKDVVDETQNEVQRLQSGILADLDNNGYGGTEVRERKQSRYDRLRDKQETIDQDQKDIFAQIYETDLSRADQDMVINFINKGILKGSKFKKGLEEMYMERTGASRSEAREWGNNVKQTLVEAGLWDEAKYVNRKEKKDDRVEKRAQRKTVENQKEVVFTEHQLKKMIDITSKMMGRDVFAEALYDKLSDLPSAREMGDSFPERHNVKELNAVLADEEKAGLIRSMLVKALPYMTVSSFQEWLTNNKAGESLEDYKNEIDARYGRQIDEKVKHVIDELPSELSLDPAATQDVQRKLRSQIVAGIAAGYMNTPRATGAGIGAGINIDHLFVGVGVGSNGMPGFVVGFNGDVEFGKNTKGSAHVGVANFIVPFARVDLQQVLNAKSLEKTLTPKRLWHAGVYAEAAPGYAGAGINVGSNLEAGINRQAESIQGILAKELGNITADMTLSEVKAELRDLFTKADEKTLDQVAEHVLYGLEQGYSLQDIASTFVAAWKNDAIIHTRGKVDFSLELGVGILFSVPVLKAFVGLKIYTRSTKREDKFDKEAKEKQLSAFKGYARFDNADTKGLSYAEKIEYRIGNKYLVEEKGELITISQNTETDTPIYDQLDVFIKDPTLVSITDHEITFNKGMNIMAGKLVGAYKDKQKVYIGYELNDKRMSKTPVNYRLEGTPEEYKNRRNLERTTVKTEKLSFKFHPELPNEDEAKIQTLIHSKAAHEKFVSMTNPTNKQKIAYNKAFGEFATSTRGANFDQMKKSMDALNKNYLHIFDAAAQKDFDAMWAKSTEHKRSIVNSFIQAGSVSAKLEAIIAHEGMKGSKNLGELLKNRKGHVEAFKNSGIVIDPHAFDKIYNNAKTLGTSKEKYSSHPELNAVAIVGYYRQGLKPTTGFVGFGGVESVAGDKFREDASKEKDVHNKFLEIYKNSPDFAAQKEMIQKSIKKFDAKAEMSDAQLIDLIKTGKITLNGMDITMTGNTFERFLNAPCANEGYKQGFGQLEITYSKKTVKPAPGNIYVAMGSTGSENSANSFKIGLGAAYGEAPKQKKPDTPPPPPPPEPEPEPEVEGEPDSNPVDPGDGINTESHNGDINVINDDPSDDPSDDGDREP